MREEAGWAHAEILTVERLDELVDLGEDMVNFGYVAVARCVLHLEPVVVELEMVVQAVEASGSVAEE